MERRRVGDVERRDIFNRLGFADRLSRGEVIEIVLRDRSPRSDYDLVPGTRSLKLEYRDAVTGEFLALVHLYQFPDGTRTLPDPKAVMHAGIRWQN